MQISNLYINQINYHNVGQRKSSSGYKTLPSFKAVIKSPLFRKEPFLNELLEMGVNKNFLVRNAELIKSFEADKFKLFYNLLKKIDNTPATCNENLNYVFLDKEIDIENYIALFKRLIQEKVDKYFFPQVLNIGRGKEAQIPSNKNISQQLYIINGNNVRNSFNVSDVIQEPNCKFTDFYKINKFLDFRLKALSNKYLLDRYNLKATVTDIDEILLTKPENTRVALDLLGEKAFIYSFKEKKDNVINFITLINKNDWCPGLYKELKKLTNPLNSEDYIQAENKVNELKSKFDSVETESELEALKKEINNATRVRNDIIRNSIKDPKDILEKTLIIAGLKNNGLIDIARDMLKILNPKTQEEKDYFNKELNKNLFKYYGMEFPSENVMQKLDFKNSKYLAKLFYAKPDFKSRFKDLIEILSMNPDKNNSEIFDELAHNQKTKAIFDLLNLRYDIWCDTNPESTLILKAGKKDTIKIQKADMNDIPHALFLGENSDCCTKISGLYDRSAIGYIMSKMVQCIEVYHNDMPIGNTMCYLAYVSNQPCLILDNIELKKQFKDDDFIRDGILAYAKQLVSDIGCKNMPIFLSAKRNDVNTLDYERNIYTISLIGYSGNNRIYIDSETNDIYVNDNHREVSDIVLCQITDNCPEPNYKATLRYQMGMEINSEVQCYTNWIDNYINLS